MGLAKALQGTVEGFSGYTKALGKKEERDYLSKEAQIASERATTMENLKQGNRMAQQKDSQKFTSGENVISRKHDIDLQGERRKDAMAVANKNFTNNKELDRLKRVADKKDIQERMDENSTYFRGTTQPMLEEAGIGPASMAVMDHAARLGHDITPLMTASLKAKSSGTLSAKDERELHLKGLEEGRKMYDSVKADPDVEEKYKMLYEQYPPGTDRIKVLQSEVLLSMGMEPIVFKNQGKKEITNELTYNSQLSEIKRLLHTEELGSTEQAESHIKNLFGPATAKKLIRDLNKKFTTDEDGATTATPALSGPGVSFPVGTGNLKIGN